MSRADATRNSCSPFPTEVSTMSYFEMRNGTATCPPRPPLPEGHAGKNNFWDQLHFETCDTRQLPSLAQAQPWPEPGPSQISGNLEPGFGILESPQKQNMKVLKLKIHVAQNVGKVWMSRNSTSRHYLGSFQTNLSMNQKIIKLA